MGSPLPQDLCGFQGNCNTGVVRYHSGRIIHCRPCCGHSRAIGVTAGRACQLASPPHLTPYWSAAVDSVGIKLDSHRLGIQLADMDLILKHVPRLLSCDFYFSEVQVSPLAFHLLPPTDDPPADCSLIGSALTVR